MELKSVVNSYIYFYHLDKFCVLPDYPETINDSTGSKFSETNALARTSPVFSYIQSGPRKVSTISFKMHRDMMNDLNRNVSNLKDNVVDFSGNDYIDILIKYLMACNMPKYNDYSSTAKIIIPPMVAIRFGNDIFIKGVVTDSVNVEYEKPILISDKYAVVTVTISVSEVDPYDADSVVEKGSFRGFTSTFKDGIYKSTQSAVTMNLKSTSTSNNNEDKPSRVVNKPKVKNTSLATTGGGLWKEEAR